MEYQSKAPIEGNKLVLDQKEVRVKILNKALIWNIAQYSLQTKLFRNLH